MAKQAEIRIGTSGYQYDHWRHLYLRRWRRRTGLLSLPRPSIPSKSTTPSTTCLRLLRSTLGAQAPHGFCFAAKYSRFGSHLKHLKDPASHLRPFLERGGGSNRTSADSGAVAAQWGVAADRLEEFLAAARRRRWAIEFRHRVGYVTLSIAFCGNTARSEPFDKFEHPRLLTAGWTYLRLSWRARGAAATRDLPAIAGPGREYQAAA